MTLIRSMVVFLPTRFSRHLKSENYEHRRKHKRRRVGTKFRAAN